MQAERGRPWGTVLHETHLLAVPREEPRAGAFEPLHGADFPIGLQREFRLSYAVRPDDSRDIDLGMVPNAEVQKRGRERLPLRQQSRTDFDFAADAEGVDALISTRVCSAEADVLPVIILRAPIHQGTDSGSGGDTDQVEPAVAIQIDHVR